MAVQFAQPYRFTVQQLACMADGGVVPRIGVELVEGMLYRAGGPFHFSSDDYLKLDELGIFGEGDRVELIDGEIIEMSPEGNRHSACIRRLIRLLSPHVGDAVVGAQDSLSLPDGYWPRPDFVVLRPDADEYEHAHPTHQDVLVVIEVSDSSLRYDRQVKAARYAQAGIPEYWLIDLTRDTISTCEVPAAGEYGRVNVYRPGDSWKSPGLGGLEIRVNDILKPR
ncbi:MAG TPA: Uma2 family endonuclease [Longimicrobium sp.]|nr:Uma2 family endonuclease [Longimicrobium sp.]